MADKTKYSTYTEEQKNEIANIFADQMEMAMRPHKYSGAEGSGTVGGTDEAEAARILKEIRNLGKVQGQDLMDRLDASYKERHGEELDDVYTSEFGNKVGYVVGQDEEDQIRALAGKAKEPSALSLGGFLWASDEQKAAIRGRGKGRSDFSKFGGKGMTDTEGFLSDDTIKAAGLYDLPPADDGPMGPFESPAHKKSATEARAKALSDFKTPTSTSNPTTTPDTKADVLQQAKDKQAKLAGTDGPYGYEGGNDQRVRDTNLLKSTRLGMREPDKSFRLRTGDEIDARNREGQFAAERHKRGALKKFRRRFGNADNERKKFIKDTGMNPEATERMARAGEESVAAQKTQKATQDRQKVLDQYKVKEPAPLSPELASAWKDDEEVKKRAKRFLKR